ncbi:MAG: ankyrin repeat domain-containing protein [Acidobacteriota bacterium]
MPLKDLLAAVRRRDVRALELALDDAGIDAVRGDGQTALHLAAEGAWEPGVRRLLDAGADPAARDDSGATPLHRAAEDGRGVDPLALFSSGESENASGASVKVGRYGRSVPFPGDPRVSRLVTGALHRLGLLAEPAAPEDPRDLGVIAVAAAFHRATWEDDARARLLGELESAAGGAEALRTRAPGLAEHLARSWPSQATCAALLGAGADLEAPDSYGATPLMVAVGHGADALVGWLLERGADLHAEDEHGDTPLREAVERGHVEIAERLLRAGALPIDVLAAAAAAGSEPMIELLLRHGADPNEESDLAEAPLHAAARYGQVAAVGLLLHAGARADTVNPYGETALHLAAASRGPIAILARLAELAGVDPVDQYGRTPLFAATEAVHREAVEALLALGADAAVRSRSKATPLHAFFEDLDAFDPDDAARLLRRLRRAGADPAAADVNGRSALDIAAAWRAPWLDAALGRVE